MAPGANDAIPRGGNKSWTTRSITVGLFGSDEKLEIPCMVHTKISELKQMLAGKTGVSEGNLEIYCKQGAYMTRVTDAHEVRAKLLVKGITSFSRQKKVYAHPHVIGGAGQGGLRMAIAFVQRKMFDIVVFERRERLGGNSWLEWANPQSKVQTELGTYHLNWSEKSEVPKGMPVWPSRDELLTHFEEVTDREGIRPYLRFKTEIMSVNIKEDKSTNELEFNFTLQDKATQQESNFQGASFLHFPGNLTNPRRETYQGEELFEGSINYGMFSEVNYENVTNNTVAIVGFGAFAVENIRTSCEYQAKKIYLLCRRKNLAMPRLISWEINSSVYPLSGAMVMRHMQKAYDMIGDDPWDYYAVQASADRQNVTIMQKSRFGIGDVYFLSRYFGACEVIVGSVKRLSPNTIHMDSGMKIEGVTAILKLLGFDPEWSVDKLMQLKEMKGFWINGDHRRCHFSELPEMNAQRFGGTSYSPGICQVSSWFTWFLNYPDDFKNMMSTGGAMIPTHKPDVAKNVPGHVIDAKLGATMFMMLGAMLPAPLAEYEANEAPHKRQKQWATHSLKEVIEAASAEWYKYCDMFKKHGYEKPIPKYLYTLEEVNAMVAEGDMDGDIQIAKQQARAK
eukprot:TRINITY_DN19479_c0_g1_i1.p1 TRINITY_DN19479_c0_g1~~TRINITY_DN19479_c0_g1_i1.p1  ORF type:complete len:633 (+),score=118.38 TRINITY_DN19479_c0_g1_i1:39-1901(+)